MKEKIIPNWLGAVLLFLIILSIYLPNISNLGTITPWEMDRITAALELTSNQSKTWLSIQNIKSEGDIAPMPIWLAAAGYKIFGISEASGRIPSLILFFISLAIAFWSIARLISVRAAYFTILILSLFPLTISQMFMTGSYGCAISFLTMSLSTLSLIRWLPAKSTTHPYSTIEKVVAVVISIISISGCYFSIGGIIGILMPILTIVIAQLISGDYQIFIPRKFKEWLRHEPGGIFSSVFSIFSILLLIILSVIIVPVATSKEPEFNLLAGGTPKIGAVPTIDYYIEHIAFGTYPWAALIPAALGILLLPSTSNNLDKKGETIFPVKNFYLIANFMGFIAVNFFAFRYHNIPYIALFPLAGAAGIFLDEFENSKSSWKIVGMISCLFLLLFMRDLHLYPNTFSELWVSQSLKDAYPVKMLNRQQFVVFTLVFMVTLFYVFLLGSGKTNTLEWFGAEIGIIKIFKGRYGKKWKVTFWFILIVWLLVVLTAIIVASNIPLKPFVLFTSIIKKTTYALAILPVIILIGDFCFRLAYNALSMIKSNRSDLLIASGFIFGFWFGNGYMPQLTKNLSPQKAVEFFKKHAGPDDELITYRVDPAIGKFFGIKNIRQVASQNAVINEITGTKKVFLLYGREDNPSLNLAYKEKTHQHIYVPEASTWRFLLASSKTLSGILQMNPIRNLVRMVPPEPEYSIYANLDNKVEYLGYDLQTNHEGDWAGALEHFTFTSYWHCTDRIPGSYKFFIHVDGYGLRLNGDHEPLDELYPTRYWRPGDYLVDVYRMQVPIHFRAGEYTIYIGLFQGEERLKQVAGPTSGDNRIQGGILKVR